MIKTARIRQLYGSYVKRGARLLQRVTNTYAGSPYWKFPSSTGVDTRHQRLFGVISWGCAATHWLAKSLNSHPDIFCVHNLNGLLEEAYGGPRIDGSQYLDFLGHVGYSYAAAGDVHGLGWFTARETCNVLGESVRLCVVVREPLKRLLSQFALFDRDWHQRVWDVDYVDRLGFEPQPGVDEYRDRLTWHGINALNLILKETKIGPVFRSEDLTTDPDALRSFVAHITGEAVKPEFEWAERVIASPPVLSHRGSQERKLGTYERDLVRRIVKPKAWDLYAALGYEVPNWV
jgi:hypothetical protein